ncbi:MAG: NAD-dependent deacylase [Chloroflexota bacterium]|nr:NAD-dependent deacylase [Chloroflexota bacterium]
MALEHDIERVAQLVLRARHTVVLTGAGHSTSSGIPDFRSPGSGLWEQANPMIVASLFAFRLRPQSFYEWIRPLARLMIEAKPNPAHYALAELEEMGLLHTVVTQNIDNLHQLAGSQRVLELHGHMREATCVRCYRVVPAEPIISKFLADGQVPVCEECGGVMKPNVILFGEQLPVQVLNEARGEARRCDLMLVAGSSLEVAPASHLPVIAHQHGAKVIIVNYQGTHMDTLAEVVIHADIAEVLPRTVEEVRKLMAQAR